LTNSLFEWTKKVILYPSDSFWSSQICDFRPRMVRTASIPDKNQFA
jgi:hypothetical protein